MNDLFMKFKVAVEVNEITSFVKMIDKRDNSLMSDLSNTLYEKITSNHNITKTEIEKVISQYSNIFLLELLKETKEVCYYDVFTDAFVSKSKIHKEAKDASFVINIDDGKHKSEMNDVHNYLTDYFESDVFILDVRHYKTSKKYYIEDFELWINSDGFEVKSQRPLFVEYFLKQYDIKTILETLGLLNNLDYRGNFLYTNDVKNDVLNAFTLDKEQLRKNVEYYYQNNKVLFINNKLLSDFGISYKEIIQKSKEPKLIVVLEKNSFDSLNYYQISSQTNKLHFIDNNYILIINETLFREACGYNTQMFFMNSDSYFAISKISKSFEDFSFISKVKVDGVKYLASILNEFSLNSQSESYLDDLMLLSFVLGSDEISRYINFYVVNGVKLGQDNRIHYNQKNSRRTKLSIDTCERFLTFQNFLIKINKKINLSKESINTLYDEIKKIVSTIKDIDTLKKFVKTLDQIIKVCDLIKIIDEFKLNELYRLIDFKKTIIEQVGIKFILDSDVLLEEPEVLTKYLNDKNVVIPSYIIEKLSDKRNTSLNSLRALRNINSIKDTENKKVEILKEDEAVNLDEYSIGKQLLILASKYSHSGLNPIIITNNTTFNSEKHEENVQIIPTEYLNLI